MEVQKEKGRLDNPTQSTSEYDPPTMITFSEEELAEELGPIHACSPFGGSVISC